MTKTKSARPSKPEPSDTTVRCGYGAGDQDLRESSDFLMGRGAVWDTLGRFARRLDEEGIHYLVMGAMALNAHGYHRVTTDIDVVVDAEARRRIHELLDGRGYLPPFTGSRNLRDATNGVKIDLVLAGDRAGTDDPKPIVFPDPSVEPVFVKDDVRYVTFEKLIELKVASGMSNPGRLKDLGDVQSVIDALHVPREFGEKLHPWVRARWYELWDAVDQDPRKGMY